MGKIKQMVDSDVVDIVVTKAQIDEIKRSFPKGRISSHDSPRRNEFWRLITGKIPGKYRLVVETARVDDSGNFHISAEAAERIWISTWEFLIGQLCDDLDPEWGDVNIVTDETLVAWNAAIAKEKV
jgi:hypothetical protein